MVAIKQLALALVLILLTTTYTGCQTQNASKETIDSVTPSVAVDDTHEDVADVTFSNVLDRSSSYEEAKKHIPFHEIPDYSNTEKIWRQKLPVDYSERYPISIPMHK